MLGILDSGVGGFSVVRPLLKKYPGASFLYVADTGHFPYSNKTPEVLRETVGKILRYFLLQKVDGVVFACNTSSALVLPKVQETFPIPMWGVIEPAITQAVAVSRRKQIGVLANDVTAQSGVFRQFILRRDPTMTVLEMGCRELVLVVENGEAETAKGEELVRQRCQMLSGKVDTLILGCTHFSFLESWFKKHLPEVHVIDPAVSLVEELPLQKGPQPIRKLITTSHAPKVSQLAKQILSWEVEAEPVSLEGMIPWESEVKKTI